MNKISQAKTITFVNISYSFYNSIYYPILKKTYQVTFMYAK